MSTLAVVEEILREVKRPVSVREIVELSGDRLPTKSKTPDTVVARDLSMDIKRKGEESIFIRTSPGRYTMRELVVAEKTEQRSDHDRQQASQPTVGEPIHGQGTTPLASAAMSESRAPTRPARAATSDGVQSSVQDG